MKIRKRYLGLFKEEIFKIIPKMEKGEKLEMEGFTDNLKDALKISKEMIKKIKKRKLGNGVVDIFKDNKIVKKVEFK